VQKVNSNQPQIQNEETVELQLPKVAPQFSIRFDKTYLNYQVVEQVGEDQVRVRCNCYSDGEKAREICDILQLFSDTGVERITSNIERQLKDDKYLSGFEGFPLSKCDVDTLVHGVRDVLKKLSSSQERYAFFDSFVDNPFAACKELVERYELPDRTYIGLPAGSYQLYPVQLMDVIEYIASIDEDYRVWSDPFYPGAQGNPDPDLF
jgi:hypothetical protein